MNTLLDVQDWIDHNLTVDNNIELGHLRSIYSTGKRIGKPEAIITFDYNGSSYEVRSTLDPNRLEDSFDKLFNKLKTIKAGTYIESNTNRK